MVYYSTTPVVVSDSFTELSKNIKFDLLQPNEGTQSHKFRKKSFRIVLNLDFLIRAFLTPVAKVGPFQYINWRIRKRRLYATPLSFVRIRHMRTSFVEISASLLYSHISYRDFSRICSPNKKIVVSVEVLSM